MHRFALALTTVLMLAVAAPALAQDAPPASPVESPAPAAAPSAPTEAAPPLAPVAVQSLSVLDLFSVGTGPGMGPDLWARSSGDLARTVIPILANRPLSPAMAALARRALSTSASGPQDAGADPGLAAARAGVLVALGDADGADAILGKTNGVADSPALSQVAAEAALIAGREDRACAVGDALTTGRTEVYWLRLRAYCQAKAGQADAAHLTLDLADSKAKDPVFRRMMTVIMAGSGDPGTASLRDGLDLTMSRRLGLDLAAAAAKAPLSVRAQVAPGPAPLALDELALKAAVDQGLAADPVSRDVQAKTALHAALGGALSPAERARLSGFDLGKAAASPARLLVMQQAAADKAKGDVVLLALAIAADAGTPGPALADRVQIVRALAQVGLVDDARSVAAEGLAASAQP